MLILVILGYAMNMFVRFEATREVRARLSESALYIADAGIAKAVHRIRAGNILEFSEYVGLKTGSKAGQAVVTITSLGNNQYQIDSTGYVPSQLDERGRRKIRSEVKVVQGGGSGNAITIGGIDPSTIKVHSYTTISGILFSNGPINLVGNVRLRPDLYGNAAIYSASFAPRAINSFGWFGISPHGASAELRARGGINVPGIWPSSPNLTFHPNDTSDKTLPKPPPSYIDEQALLASVTHTNYTFGVGVEYPLGSGRMVFNNLTVDLAGGVYLFTSGVVFNGHTTFDGHGTIVVKTTGDVSAFDYGMHFHGNLFNAVGHLQPAQVNLIVLDGNWNKEDIYLFGRVSVEGLIQSNADIRGRGGLNVNGAIVVGGNLDYKGDMNIEYRVPEFGFPSGPSGGGITVISWREKR